MLVVPPELMSRGAVEACKYSDLIAVKGNLLKDITLLQRIKFVMKGHIVVKNILAH